MPEYKKQETKVMESTFINEINFIPGDSSIDIKGLRKIFTGKNLDAKKLRAEAWTRKKI